MKRIISMLLCLIMVLTTVMAVVPVHIHAEETNAGETIECPAELVNINTFDSNGVFQYIEEYEINDGQTVTWVTWNGNIALKDLGMFDGKNETASVIKSNPNVGINSAIKYINPMYITEVVIVSNASHKSNGTGAQTHAKLEVSDDGSDWTLVDEIEIPESGEVKFELNESVTYMRATCYGAAYEGEISEFIAYSEIGHSYDTLVPEKSVASTCTKRGTNVYKCACGKEISEPAPLHNLENETITKHPTINQTGTLEGTCKDCKEVIERVIPTLNMKDYIDAVTENDVKISQELPEGISDHYKRKKDAIIDGIIQLDPYAGNGTDNFWFGPAGSKLKIEFNQEVILYSAVLHVYSNWSGFSIEFLGEKGNSVYSYTNDNYQGANALSFTNDIAAKKVKSIVITVNHAKGSDGSMQIFSELSMTAHKCQYDEKQITNVTEGDNCSKTFDGACMICEWEKTNVTYAFHNNVRDDSVGENYFEPTCVSNGFEKLVCTKCGEKQDIVMYATGKHDYKDAKLEYKDNKQPTCAEGATAWKLCNVCQAKGEEVTFEPTGEHKYEPKVTVPSTYTKQGLQESRCIVCDGQEPGTDSSPAELAKLNPNFTQKDYSLRRTDFVAVRVTFQIDLSKVETLEEEGYDVKIYGVVVNGEKSVEVQVYGDGATGVYDERRGTFSIVVKNPPSYEQEYEYYAKMVITDANGTTDASVVSKDMSSNKNTAVSIYEAAKHYVKKYKDDRKDMCNAIIDKVEGTTAE